MCLDRIFKRFRGQAQFNVEGFTENVSDIKDKLSIIAKKAQQFAETTIELSEDFKDVEEIDEDDTKVNKLLQKYREHFERVQKCSGAFLTEVKKCLEQALLSQEKRRKIKRDVRNRRYREFNKYVLHLVEQLENCESAHTTFLSTYKDSEELCGEGMKECESEIQAAERSEGNASTIGMVAQTAGGIVTMAGLGTPVLLIIGSAIFILSKILTNTTTEKYQSRVKKFQKCQEIFLLIKERCSEIKIQILKISELLKAIKYDANSAYNEQDELYDIESFCKQFDILLEGIDNTCKESD